MKSPLATPLITLTLLLSLFIVSSSSADTPIVRYLTPDGFISSWLVLKPIVGDDRWTKDHLAELGGVEKADPKLGDKTAGLSWRPIATKKNGAVDLGTQNQALAYAFCRLESSAEREVLIRIGADDAYVLWINGVKVRERHSSGTMDPDVEQFACTLKQGINRILIKIDNYSGGWGFFFRLVDLAKTPNVAPPGFRTWLKSPTTQEIENAPWDMGIVVPQDAITAKITLTPNVITKQISPLMYGSNLMWWEGFTAPDGSKPSRAWETFKDMGITCLRFPGGADCHPYRWHSIEASVKAYKAANFWQHYHMQCMPQNNYSYQTFLDLCKQYNIEPILQVSVMAIWDEKSQSLGWSMNGKDLKYIDPAVEYAAAWVRDAKKNGYRVKYWEIGNEEGCYPTMTGDRYGQWVKKFVRAMKAADPEIKIIATGHRNEWNTGLLKQAGKDIDYLSWHYWSLQEPVGDYPPGMGLIPCKFFTAEDLKKAPDDQLYLAHLAAMIEGKKTLDFDLYEPIRKYAPHAKIAWTEWNWPGFGSRYNFSIAQALLNVEQFFHMLAQDCQIANYWSVTGLNFQMIAYWKPYPYYPFGDAFRMLQRYARGQLQQVNVDASPTPIVKGVRVPLVTAYACKNGNAWSVFILNHHPSQKAKVTLPSLPEFTTPDAPITRAQLTALYLTQGAEINQHHTDVHKLTEDKIARPTGPMELELEPHSMIVLSQGF